MATRFHLSAVLFLFGISFLVGCGSKDAEGVPPGVNLPPPPDREKSPKIAFSLKIQPEVVKLTQGGKAKILIVAERKGYDGPIVIELSNLPAKVSPAAKAAIASGAKQVEIEILAAQDAEVGEKTNASVMASVMATSNLPLVTSTFTIKVEKATAAVAAKLFDLKINPETVKLTQGGEALVRVTATRINYQGPIVVELVNLPGLVTAEKKTIGPEDKDVVLKLIADKKAVIGDSKGVAALASTSNNKSELSDPFTVWVLEGVGLFVLRGPEEPVEVKQGEKVKVVITVDRKGYDGPIVLELANLPDKVTMNKVTIPAGQFRKAIDIVADKAAPEGKKVGVTVLANAVDAEKTIVSKPFAIVVTKGATSTTQTPPFDLKVEPATVKLRAGTKIKLRVTVVRQSTYQGPIVVELKNLPAVVKSGKLTLKEGQSFGDIELWALPNAPTGQITDVTPVGTASAAKDQQVPSASTITVNVYGNPVVVVPIPVDPPPRDVVWFDLKLAPQTVNIKQGNFGIVRVSVTRKNGFAGPVAVQLKGLPNSIQARTGTVAKNQNYVDLQIFANPRAPIGTSVSVSAVGTGRFGTVQQQQTSPAITINVVKK